MIPAIYKHKEKEVKPPKSFREALFMSHQSTLMSLNSKKAKIKYLQYKFMSIMANTSYSKQNYP